MMALVVLDRRAVLQADQNRVDPMVLQPPEWHPEVDVSALPTEIRVTLGKLEAFAVEAARERRSHLHHEPDPEPLARTLARLQTDVSTLGRVLIQPLPAAAHQHLAEPW